MSSCVIIAKEELSNYPLRYIHYIKHDNTLLVIIPFSTSPSGLNSDYLKNKVAKRISELLNEK